MPHLGAQPVAHIHPLARLADPLEALGAQTAVGAPRVGVGLGQDAALERRVQGLEAGFLQPDQAGGVVPQERPERFAGLVPQVVVLVGEHGEVRPQGAVNGGVERSQRRRHLETQPVARDGGVSVALVLEPRDPVACEIGLDGGARDAQQGANDPGALALRARRRNAQQARQRGALGQAHEDGLELVVGVVPQCQVGRAARLAQRVERRVAGVAGGFFGALAGAWPGFDPRDPELEAPARQEMAQLLGLGVRRCAQAVVDVGGLDVPALRRGQAPQGVGEGERVRAARAADEDARGGREEAVAGAHGEDAGKQCVAGGRHELSRS
ncbi:hypothetical protein D3C86_1000030 [compost metagenome]